MTERKTLAQVYWEIEDQFKAALEQHGAAKNVHELIKMFCTARDETCSEGGRTVHLGHSPGLETLKKALPPGFKEVEEWEDWPYRVVWISEAELSICTYCEGDVSIIIFKDGQAYQQELEESAEFYKTH
ncbi:MAG: hypothetical protein ACXQTL_00615 [Methanosarcinales archaeon]